MTASSEFVSMRVPELRWQYSKAISPRFELTQQGLLAATLERALIPHSTAICKCSEGEWLVTIKTGLLKNTAKIESLPGNVVVGECSFLTPYPEKITLGESREFAINHCGGFVHKLEVLDNNSDRLVLYRPTDMSLANIFRIEATVEVTNKGICEPHLPALIFFIWHAVLWSSSQVSG